MILILSLSFFSCAKTQSLGAGVTVDPQGNLKIDAPLYVIDKNPKKPDLKPAPASMNLPVDAGIYLGEDVGNSLEVTGGIVNGRLSLTIKKPEEDFYASVASIWKASSELFTGGADVQIGELYLSGGYHDYYVNSSPILLYSNHSVVFSKVYEHDMYSVEGNQYEYIYSLGEVNITGKVNKPLGDAARHRNFDIHLKHGWNVISINEYFDNILQEYVFNKTSSLPSSEAVWVLME